MPSKFNIQYLIYTVRNETETTACPGIFVGDDGHRIDGSIGTEHFNKFYLLHVFRNEMTDLSKTGLGAIIAMNKRLELAGVRNYSPFNQPPKFNYTWCQVEVSISNTGSRVLEDWKLELRVSKDGVKGIRKKRRGRITSCNDY